MIPRGPHSNSETPHDTPSNNLERPGPLQRGERRVMAKEVMDLQVVCHGTKETTSLDTPISPDIDQPEQLTKNGGVRLIRLASLPHL